MMAMVPMEVPVEKDSSMENDEGQQGQQGGVSTPRKIEER